MKNVNDMTITTPGTTIVTHGFPEAVARQMARKRKDVNDMNRDELRAEAKALEIPGRGKMTAAELRAAVEAARAEVALTELRTHPRLPEIELFREDPYTLPAPLPALSARFRDRLARGELVVRTQAGVPGRTASQQATRIAQGLSLFTR